ncbi:hypothetical protein MRB53_042094 [Persea americana]|nr:hypothetical protein MRB53_042094 [Persea americana]
MSARSSAASAPGKVLVAGGYLVLDRKYTGLVFGLDARIHVIVKDDSNVKSDLITVRSPQFDQPAWQYKCNLKDQTGLEINQLENAAQEKNRNPFVETALRYALTYIVAVEGAQCISPLSITILADNDYYSTSSLQETQRFHNFGVPIAKANKTGLGSSAALVTSFTAALLVHLLPKHKFDLSSNKSRHILHNLAQAAHCAAQGKVGSGFDVASAVFGSCIYRRFSPEILSSLPEPGTANFSDLLRRTVDEDGLTWDTEILKDQVTMPKGLRMVMCDVSCGSQTPGMVKKVLAWRAENPDVALRLWSDIQSNNSRLAQILRQATNSGSTNYSDLASEFMTMRAPLRAMSEQSGVAIEPPAQTQLIDACCELDGVIGGTVPGAGGYDAIVLLIEDKKEVTDKLQQLFSTWQFQDDSGGQGKVSMLGVREELEGARQEDAQSYAQWIRDHVA